MEEPCKDCKAHNEYGQRLASNEVRIEDMKESINGIKGKLTEIWDVIDRLCTKKAFFFLVTSLLMIFLGIMGSHLSLHKSTSTITTEVRAIQQTLEKEPWK